MQPDKISRRSLLARLAFGIFGLSLTNSAPASTQPASTPEPKVEAGLSLAYDYEGVGTTTVFYDAQDCCVAVIDSLPASDTTYTISYDAMGKATPHLG